MSNEAAIQAIGLTKRFGSFTACDNVSFSVGRGEIFGFLGPNGAGKSTMIRMLCGLLTPTSGQGIVAGRDIAHASREVRRRIGYMSQKFALYETMTVEQNLDFFAGIYGIDPEKIEQRKDAVIAATHLEGLQKSRPGDLPGGLRQRLALATAILHEPEVLFLDEPTGGVDPVSRRNFWDLISHLSDQGITIFVTTHFLDEAEYCTTIGFLYFGRLVAMGPPHDLKKKEMSNTILEVETSQPTEALTIFGEEKEWIEETSMFGREIHLSVPDPDLAEARIGPLLQSKGIEAIRVQRIEPSLEDVFIHLISRETERS